VWLQLARVSWALQRQRKCSFRVIVAALKMLDVKMTNVKLMGQMTGHENAGHEIAGHETTGHKRTRCYETGSEAANV